jgi:WD40 repeat protein
LATASDEAVFRLWDAGTGKPLKDFAGRAAFVTISGDGRTLASSSMGDGVCLWDPATAQRLGKLDPHLYFSSGGRIAFLAGKPPLLVCDLNGNLAAWDAATGKLWPHVFIGEMDIITSSITQRLPFAVAGDAKTVAVNTKLSGNGPVSLRDARTGMELLRTAVLGSILAVSPDARWLAVRTKQGVVLVDGRSGKEKRRLEETGTVGDAAFSPDGRMLATGSADGAVRLWETMSGRERHRFTGHEQAVRCVAFSADGKYLASGSDDMTVLVWEVFRQQANNR